MQTVNGELYIKALKAQRDGALDSCAQLMAINEEMNAKIEALAAAVTQLQQPADVLQPDAAANE